MFILGNTALMAKRNDEAIAIFEQVIRLKPGHEPATSQLAVARARKELGPKLPQWREAALQEPTNPAAHSNVGEALHALGYFEEAEKEFEWAINLNPKDFAPYNLLAINYSEWGKLDKAVDAWKRAVALNPHHVLYFSLGSAYKKLGKLEEAAQAFEKSIEIKPTFVQSLYELGTIRFTQGRNQEAAELLRRVLAIDPTNATVNYSLGVIYNAMGNKTAAMQQYYVLKDLNSVLAEKLRQSLSN